MFRKQYINFKEIDYIKKYYLFYWAQVFQTVKKIIRQETKQQLIIQELKQKTEQVAKEATEDTLASIRNNPNVITGEEGRLLAESIPMDRREYVKWGRVFRGTAITFLGGFRT